MAKKKSGRTNEKQPEQDLPQQDPPAVQRADLMEDSESKLSKLKSLNEMLLKETTERRKEVRGLIDSKKVLEGELSRSSSELDDLRLELVRVRDSQADNQMSKDVVTAFVESKVRDEVERLREINERLVRDSVEVEAAKAKEVRVLKKDLEAGIEKYSFHVEESNRLREKLRVIEAKGRIKEEAMKGELEGLVRVRNEMGKEIGAMKREIEEKSMALEESRVRIGALEREIESVGREKLGVEKERGELNVRVGELVKEVKVLNGIVVALRKSEKEQRERFVELESVYGEGLEKEKDLKRELSTLFEESKKKDGVIGELMEEKLKAVERLNVLEKELETAEEVKRCLLLEKDRVVKEKNQLGSEIVKLLDEVSKLRTEVADREESCSNQSAKNKQLSNEIDVFKREIDRVSLERDEVRKVLNEEKMRALERLGVLEKELEAAEDVKQSLLLEKGVVVKEKNQLESDIVKFVEQVSMLRVKIAEGEELCRNQSEKNMQLSSEIDRYRKEFERVSVERDEVGKALDVEKMNGKKLNSKLKELSKKMEDGAKEMESLKGTNDDLVEKKKGLEVNVKKLVGEKGVMEKKLMECKKQIGVLEESVRIKNETLEQSVLKLKNAAEKLTKATVEMVGVGSIQINERNLNGDLEPYMDQLEAIRAAFANKETEVEVMKQQVDSLQKKKSFWTLVSSATTILAAAVSFAYASKLR